MMFNCPACDKATRHQFSLSRDGYDIFRCEYCSLGRTNVTDFRPEDHYDAGYFSGQREDGYRDYVGSAATLSKEFVGTLDFLRQMGPKTGRLLEIGCAYGFFLQEASRYYEVSGVEISDDAVAHCHESGLSNVHAGRLRENTFPAGTIFDAIVMLDVIEHLDELEETISASCKMLQPGGVLLVTTGDWDSLFARMMGPRWRLMTPPLHLWFFSKKSIATLLQRFDCELVSFDHPWKLVPLELIAHQAGIMLGLPPPRLPAAVKNMGLPANLFDAMRVVFRKRKY